MTPFYPSMDVVFLAYGLAFLSLGLTIVILNERDSALEVSRVLWLLAAFGFVHGFHEWLDLWRIVHGDAPGLASTRPVVLLTSYLFLFEFGRRLILISLSSAQHAYPARQFLSPWIYAPMLFGILFATAVSTQPTLTLSTWSRHLPGFVGPCLAGAGFYLYGHNRIGTDAATSDYPGAGVASYAAAAAFVLYGILGGLVGLQSDWFPASSINEENFLATFKVPVQLLRAVCSTVAAVSVGYLLRIFRQNNLRKLSHAIDIGRHALAEFYRILPRFEAILDSTMEGIVGLDGDGNVNFANGSALLMLGYRKEELIGKPFSILSRRADADGSDRLREDCPVYLTLKTGVKHRADDERLWRKNRTWFPVAYQVAPLMRGNQIHGVVIAFRDTVEAKLTERRLHAVEYSHLKENRHEARLDARVTV